MHKLRAVCSYVGKVASGKLKWCKMERCNTLWGDVGADVVHTMELSVDVKVGVDLSGAAGGSWLAL